MTFRLSWPRRIRGLFATAALVWTIGGCSSTPPDDNSNQNTNGNVNDNGAGRCAGGSELLPATVSYSLDIVPLLNLSGCVAVGCHAPPGPTSGFDLTLYETTFGPGDLAREMGICNVVPGDPDASFLIDKVTSETPAEGDPMPQEGERLTAEQIELIRIWILEGAQNN